MVNSYKKGSHFSRRKFREILRYFSEDINASTVAKFTGLDRKTINKIFLEIRQIIAKHCENNSIFGVGEIELDESYFGARRVRGNVIKFSRIKREIDVAHMAKFPFPLNAGMLDKHLEC